MLLLVAGCGNRHTDTIRRVEILMDQGQYVPALDELTAEIRKDPKSAPLKRLRVVLLIRYERIDLAYQAYLDLQDISKNDQILADSLRSKDSKVRAGAARMLGLVKTPTAMQNLEKLLKDPDRDVRRATVAALGDVKDKRATAQLVKALQDEWWFVRSDAAQALGKIRDVNAVEPLFGVIGDSDPSVQLAAENALLTIARLPDAPHDVYAKYVTSDNADAKRVAVLSLSILKDRSVVPALLEMAAASDPRKRAQATRGLGILGDPAGLDAIRKGVSDPEAMVRLQAVEALSSYPSADSAKLLKSVAENNAENTIVRRAATVALKIISDQQAAATPAESSGTPATAP